MSRLFNLGLYLCCLSFKDERAIQGQAPSVCTMLPLVISCPAKPVQIQIFSLIIFSTDFDFHSQRKTNSDTFHIQYHHDHLY